MQPANDSTRAASAAAASGAAAPAVVSSSALPDASWTVEQIKDWAQRKGISGLSGKSKQELLVSGRGQCQCRPTLAEDGT